MFKLLIIGLARAMPCNYRILDAVDRLWVRKADAVNWVRKNSKVAHVVVGKAFTCMSIFIQYHLINNQPFHIHSPSHIPSG